MAISPVQPMAREELLELAALDAFGLLSDYEASLYTRSFHHATAGVQDEVLTLQAELVSDINLLSADDPPASLRKRVLLAVADAVETESAELRPLATIGKTPRRTATPSMAHRSARRGGVFWRAAALVMMATTVVMGYFWVEARSQSNVIKDVVLGIRTDRDLADLVGPGYREFHNNPNCKRIVLHHTELSTGVNATVFINPHTNQAFVLAMGLPTDMRCSFSAVFEDGTTKELGTLAIEGGIGALRLDTIVASTLSTATLQISIDGIGAVLRS